jgi:group I intron endonuclease
VKLSEYYKCKNKSGIYIITNTITNTSYVGQAINISRRLRQHLRSSISVKASDYDYPLHQSIRKHGVDNFTFDILEECLPELFNEREMYWVAFYDTHKNGYNQTAGGYQSIRQIKLNASDINQIIDRLMNTDDSYVQIAKDFNICTDMVKRINLGDCWNNSALKYPLRNGDAIRLKNILNTGTGVYQLDKKTGEVLNIFVSASQASIFLGNSDYCAHIGKCLAGKRASAYGYRWETRPITEAQFKVLVKKAKIADCVKQLVEEN